jgi:hypothetical protein
MADKLEDEVNAILRGDEAKGKAQPKTAPKDKPPKAPATATSAAKREQYKREAIQAIRELNALALASPEGIRRWALSDDPRAQVEAGGKPPNETEALAGIIAGARVYYPQLGSYLEGGGKLGLMLSAGMFAAVYLGTRLGTAGLLRAIPMIGPRAQAGFEEMQQRAAEAAGRAQAAFERSYLSTMNAGMPGEQPSVYGPVAPNGAYPEGQG